MEPVYILVTLKMNKRDVVFLNKSEVLQEIAERVIAIVSQYYNGEVTCIINADRVIPKKWGGFLFPLKLKIFNKNEVNTQYQKLLKVSSKKNIKAAADSCYRDTKRRVKKSKSLDVKVALVRSCRDIPYTGVLIFWER